MALFGEDVDEGQGVAHAPKGLVSTFVERVTLARSAPVIRRPGRLVRCVGNYMARPDRKVDRADGRGVPRCVGECTSGHRRSSWSHRPELWDEIVRIDLFPFAEFEDAAARVRLLIQRIAASGTREGTKLTQASRSLSLR